MLKNDFSLIWKNLNYILKVKYDIREISNSFEGDPFFISVLNIENVTLRRIRACELILLKEEILATEEEI